MKVLIIGAAGMIGRKLTARLARDGRLADKTIDHAHLVDIVAPQPLAERALPGHARRLRHRRALRRAEAGRGAAGRHFPARLGGLRRGRGGFRQGLRHQCRRNPGAVRGGPARAGAGRRRLSAAPHLHLLDRRLRRAVPRQDRRRIRRRAADQLRNPEGDLRAFARRLFAARLLRRHRPAPADDLRAPRRAQQGGLWVLFRHHPRAARTARRRSCRSATRSATGTPRPAPRSSSCCARRNSISPCSALAARSVCRG